MNDFETEKELDEKTVVWQFTLGDAKGHASRFLFFGGYFNSLAGQIWADRADV